MSAALPALLQLLLRLVLRRERLGVAIRGLRSSGQPYWASVSTHSWQLAWRAYAIALLPWASLAIKSTPYYRKNQRGIVINHLLPLKPRITGIPALFFLTQIRSCVMTTLPLWLARCSALRPSPSPQVSLTCCRDPWASRSTTARRSSSAVALSSCWPSGRSVQGSDARKRRCSYFARIQRSRSSLMEKRETDTFKNWQLSNGCSMKCHIAARNMKL